MDTIMFSRVQIFGPKKCMLSLTQESFYCSYAGENGHANYKKVNNEFVDYFGMHTEYYSNAYSEERVFSSVLKDAKLTMEIPKTSDNDLMNAATLHQVTIDKYYDDNDAMKFSNGDVIKGKDGECNQKYIVDYMDNISNRGRQLLASFNIKESSKMTVINTGGVRNAPSKYQNEGAAEIVSLNLLDCSTFAVELSETNMAETSPCLSDNKNMESDTNHHIYHSQDSNVHKNNLWKSYSSSPSIGELENSDISVILHAVEEDCAYPSMRLSSRYNEYFINPCCNLHPRDERMHIMSDPVNEQEELILDLTLDESRMGSLDHLEIWVLFLPCKHAVLCKQFDFVADNCVTCGRDVAAALKVKQ